jgi:formate transporter
MRMAALGPRSSRSPPSFRTTGRLAGGNNLIVMARASGRASMARMLHNWVIVYLGNVVGALGLVVLVVLSRHLEMNNGRLAQAVIDTASANIRPDFVTSFFKGILCNVLVCMAVWLAYAGRSVTDKIVDLVLPISAFVAAGFDHCIANLYFLPLAWVIVQTGAVPANLDVSAITVTGIVHNLVRVTLGNIVGGAGLVDFVYWAIYRKGLGAGVK